MDMREDSVGAGAAAWRAGTGTKAETDVSLSVFMSQSFWVDYFELLEEAN
jgi:hypothetical protein